MFTLFLSLRKCTFQKGAIQNFQNTFSSDLLNKTLKKEKREYFFGKGTKLHKKKQSSGCGGGNGLPFYPMDASG